MNIKFKKLSILLLISGATLLFAASDTPGQSFEDKKSAMHLTAIQGKAFIEIKTTLDFHFKGINEQAAFLAPSVKVGAYPNPTDRSFKSFKSTIFQFIEKNPAENIAQLKTNLGKLFLGLVTKLDDNFLDESVKIPKVVPLNGRSAKNFSEYLDHIVDYIEID